MSQPKRKLSLKPTLTNVNPAAEQWIEGRQVKTEIKESLNTETQKPRDIKTQKQGDTEAQKHRDIEAQKQRDTEAQKHRDIEAQKQGDTETWKQGDTETQKQYKRITLDVSPELHYKLKKHTLETGEPMSELLRRLAENFLAQQ